jgi:hypothetical protein
VSSSDSSLGSAMAMQVHPLRFCCYDDGWLCDKNQTASLYTAYWKSLAILRAQIKAARGVLIRRSAAAASDDQSLAVKSSPDN